MEKSQQNVSHTLQLPCPSAKAEQKTLLQLQQQKHWNHQDYSQNANNASKTAVRVPTAEMKLEVWVVEVFLIIMKLHTLWLLKNYVPILLCKQFPDHNNSQRT